MYRNFLLLIVLISSPLFSAEKGDSLVCLHGFMGGTWSMSFIERSLEKQGWDVTNWQYPSRDALIVEHADRLAHKLLELSEEKPGRPIHFVVHSMGSLVLLSALNHPLCPDEAKIGKVVLITPPLKGSFWGRWLNQFPFVRWIAKGFSGHELMTKTDFSDLGDYPGSLEKVLVIAGNLGLNPFLQGANDGTLTVEETSLSIPHDRVIINRGHKTIVFSKKVCQLVSEFLVESPLVYTENTP